MTLTRKAKRHLKSLCSYWDDEGFHDGLDLVLDMFDALLETRAALDDDEIVEVCRAINFAPDHFNRFIRMAELHRENVKSKGPPSFVKPHSISAEYNYFRGQPALGLGERLRQLLVRHIRALDEQAPERNSPSLPSDFNYGVRIVGLLEIASRVYKMAFILGHELSEACRLSVKPAPTAHVYFEVWASGMRTFEMSGDEAEQFLSQVHLDSVLTNQCVNNSDDDGASLLARIDEAMTAITLAGHSSVDAHQIIRF